MPTAARRLLKTSVFRHCGQVAYRRQREVETPFMNNGPVEYVPQFGRKFIG